MIDARVRPLTHEELEDDLLVDFIQFDFGCQWFALDIIINEDEWQTIDIFNCCMN